MDSNSKVGGIIFSRFDSNRLFGKALIDIEGRALLGRVIDRSKLIKGISKLIVATSERPIDNQIHEFAKTMSGPVRSVRICSYATDQPCL